MNKDKKLAYCINCKWNFEVDVDRSGCINPKNLCPKIANPAWYSDRVRTGMSMPQKILNPNNNCLLYEEWPDIIEEKKNERK